MKANYDVFLSYSHVNTPWVRDFLLVELEGAGVSVCVDYRDFDVGVPSIINMERAVERSRRTLLVLTPSWVASEWTAFESLLAQTRDPAGLRARLLPLMLEDTPLPPRLGMLTYADFRDQSEWTSSVHRLIGTI